MLSTNSEFFLEVAEATGTLSSAWPDAGHLALWRRLASSPAAQRQFLSEELILKNAYVYCGKNCGRDYLIPRDKRINKN